MSKKNFNKKNLYIKIVIIVGVVFLVLFILFVLLSPKLTINGDRELKLEYGNKYKEPGYEATFFGKDISNKVHVNGKVNNKKLGSYEIKYKVRKNMIVITKKRIVDVIDSKKPDIKLKGGENVDVCPDKEYSELGYDAIDNYDGNITKKVKIEKEENKVIYKVSDSSGNSCKVVRNYIKQDKTKPKITLKGSNKMTIIVNNSYKEPGYSAIDNCDKDITKNVKVYGKVNNNSVGTYKVTYEVSDKAGNKESVTREVKVEKSYPRVSGNMSCGSPGVIYLTFDDGPNPTTTPTILDTLKRHGVKATFFVVGRVASGNKNLLRREVNEGHAIGIHTWSHDYSIVYRSSDNFWNEINKTAKLIKDETGKDTKLIRFPGGASNTVSRHYNIGIMSRLSNEVISKGYNYYDWNISSGDASSNSLAVKTEINNVTKNLSKNRGNVVLMHDIKKSTMNAIDGIIQYGKDNGYSFDVLNHGISCKQGVAN